jgi:hypothetical protein
MVGEIQSKMVGEMQFSVWMISRLILDDTCPSLEERQPIVVGEM